MKQKETTRRKKALWRSAVVVVLILFMWVGGYAFLPSQGRHYNEESFHTGRTKLVERIYEPSLKATRMALFDLTANEDVTMLHCVRWHPLYGWMGASASVIECWETAPLHAGFCSLSHKSSEEDLFFVFGRLDSMDITSIKISLQCATYVGEERQEVWVEDCSRTSERTEWTEKDGHRYFVENFGLLSKEVDRPMKVVLTAYDAEGEEVSSVDATYQGTYVGLG